MLSLMGLSPMFADASASSTVMQAFVTPAVATICALASLACVFFLVLGGIQYSTSTGSPEKLGHAKIIIRNALVGLVMVLAAATLTALLAHAYSGSGGGSVEKLPSLMPIEPDRPDSGLVNTLTNAVVGLLKNIVQSVGAPFLSALSYFLNSTPLMGANSSVFNLWLAMVGIADALFVLIVALLGFHKMSAASFGFEEVDLKHMVPQIILVFLLINISIFAIDAIISLSNAMIYALQSGFPSTDVWGVLAQVTKKSGDLGVAGLLVMVAFLILSVMLLIYYVGRLIALYLGAILAPVVLLLWLLPPFKDFAISALKSYLVTIFVLFVHVVILLLAASLFSGMLKGDMSGQPNALMALILGLATVASLLKTQGFMQELSVAASAPKAARQMAGSFMRGVSYMKGAAGAPGRVVKSSKGLARSIDRKLTVIEERKAAKKERATTAASDPAAVVASAAFAGRDLKTGETRQANARKEKS